MTNNNIGIVLDYGFGNYITENVVTSNSIGVVPLFGSNNIVSGNTVTNNWFYSIDLLFTSHNTIINNTVTSNEGYGIYVALSGGNTISGNTVTENLCGILLTSSGGNILRDNNMTKNRYNFGVDGTLLMDFINDIDTSNIVEGKPVYYLVDQADLVVDSSLFPDVGYLGIVNSKNITARNLTLTKNYHGILLAFTTNSTIENVDFLSNLCGLFSINSNNNTVIDNNINNNDEGIFITYSSNNSIKNNKIKNSSTGLSLYGSNNNNVKDNTIDNNSEGIWIFLSNDNIMRNNKIKSNGVGLILPTWKEITPKNNKIYHNNFVNNTKQLYRGYENITNRWTDRWGVEGNYWDDYNGTDWNQTKCSLGIGDDYLPWLGVDYHPLMSGYIPGDIDHDGYVYVQDLSLLGAAWYTTPGDPNWNPHADLNEDARIDEKDLQIMQEHWRERWSDCSLDLSIDFETAWWIIKQLYIRQ